MSIRNLALNLLNFFTAIVIGILSLRFILKLFGASETNGFVGWIYEMSAVLLEPFRGIFPTRVFENRFVLEFSTLFAMVIYALLALVIAAGIAALTPDSDTTVIKKR